MGLGVILHPVAPPDDLRGQAGVGAPLCGRCRRRSPSRRGHPGGRAPGGDVGVRAVVEGEGDLAAAGGLRGEPPQVGSHPGTAGPQAGGGEEHVVGDEGAGDGRPPAGRRGQGEEAAGVEPEGAREQGGRPVARLSHGWTPPPAPRGQAGPACRGRCGEGLDEDDAARHLVGREVGPAPVHHVSGCEPSRPARHHGPQDLAAPSGAGRPSTATSSTPAQPRQDALDLPRVDLLALDVDQIVHPAPQSQLAPLPGGEVAGLKAAPSRRASGSGR